ncbi:hypothetical protein TSAR_008526, partial [Trichomalopsis sarcophagae]
MTSDIAFLTVMTDIRSPINKRPAAMLWRVKQKSFQIQIPGDYGLRNNFEMLFKSRKEIFYGSFL